MTRSELERFIRDAYEARLTNDVEKCASLFAPNSWFRIAGSLEINPVARAGHTTPEVRRQLATLIQLWSWLSFDFKDVIIEGDRVAVHYSLTAVFNPTKETIDAEVVDLITVTDRKIRTFLQFFDSATATRLGPVG
jgi:ketosteroid isomerase-like protein